MLKFIKYEIKGNYRFIFAMILAVILASTVFQVSLRNDIFSYDMVGQLEQGVEISANEPSAMGIFLIILSIFFMFGVALVTFLKIVGSFKDEITEDRGYLTFTLPLKGSQILGGKFITAILWYFIIGISIVLYNIFLAAVLYKFDFSAIKPILEVIKIGKSGIKMTLFLSVLSSIVNLLLIYLSMAISRIGFKNNKFSGFWFIIYIVISGVFGYISNFVVTKVNYFMSVDGFNIINGLNLNNFGGSVIASDMNHFYINIGYILFQIFLAIGTFALTSYLIENKIDL